MTYRYATQNTCSYEIEVEMDGDVLKHAQFFGGCNGNLQALSILTAGMPYAELKEKLSGIRCGFKNTSCADQLVRAVEAAMAQEAQEAQAKQ